MNPVKRTLIGLAFCAFGACVIAVHMLLLHAKIDMAVIAAAMMFVMPGLFLIDAASLPAIGELAAKVVPFGRRKDDA